MSDIDSDDLAIADWKYGRAWVEVSEDLCRSGTLKSHSTRTDLAHPDTVAIARASEDEGGRDIRVGVGGENESRDHREDGREDQIPKDPHRSQVWCPHGGILYRP